MAQIGTIKQPDSARTQPVGPDRTQTLPVGADKTQTQPVGQDKTQTQPIGHDKTLTLQLSPKGEDEDKTVKMEKSESTQKMAAAPPAPAFNPDITTKLELVKDDDDDKTVRLPGSS